MFAIVGCSHGSGLSLDGLSLGDHNAGLDLGSHTGGSLTLGEISLHHEDELPGIDLGETGLTVFSKAIDRAKK